MFLSKKQLQKLKNIIAENDRYKIIRKHQQKLGILKTRFNKLSVKLQAVGLEIKNIESSL